MNAAMRYKACETCKEHVRGLAVSIKPSGLGTTLSFYSRDATESVPASAPVLATATTTATATATEPSTSHPAEGAAAAPEEDVPIPTPAPAPAVAPPSPVPPPVPVTETAAEEVVVAVAVTVAAAAEAEAAVAATEDIAQETAAMDVTAPDVEVDNNDREKESVAIEVNQLKESSHTQNHEHEDDQKGVVGELEAEVKTEIKVEVKQEGSERNAADALGALLIANPRTPTFLKCTRCPSVYHHSCALEAMREDAGPESAAPPVTEEKGWAENGDWICPLCR